jgi:hypothetical protein
VLQRLSRLFEGTVLAHKCKAVFRQLGEVRCPAQLIAPILRGLAVVATIVVSFVKIHRTQYRAQFARTLPFVMFDVTAGARQR